ncbi:MAG TPA: NAD(P)-dependent oxidoreductase [Polyangiales bacterium]|nr:NAD(P)-dependent oxidoreductase [Polyangiales bacterium]
MKIGFIGLGSMGVGVARRLLKAGHTLTVWNRSPAPVQALVAEGAVAAQDPAQALQGELVLSLLASDAALRDVGLDGALLDRAAPGLVHVNLATISIELARSLAEAHASRGLGYVAMPVFGRPEAAAAGELALVLAGKTEHVARVQPILGAIGKTNIVLGERPEHANLFKIAGNFMIASTIETIGEAYALLRKGGVDPAPFYDLLAATVFASPVFKNYGKLILDRRFEPAGFKLPLGLKDVNLARESAAQLGATLPIAELLKERFAEALERGWHDKDWTAVTALDD